MVRVLFWRRLLTPKSLSRFRIHEDQPVLIRASLRQPGPTAHDQPSSFLSLHGCLAWIKTPAVWPRVWTLFFSFLCCGNLIIEVVAPAAAGYPQGAHYFIPHWLEHLHERIIHFIDSASWTLEHLGDGEVTVDHVEPDHSARSSWSSLNFAITLLLGLHVEDQVVIERIGEFAGGSLGKHWQDQSLTAP